MNSSYEKLKMFYPLLNSIDNYQNWGQLWIIERVLIFYWGVFKIVSIFVSNQNWGQLWKIEWVLFCIEYLRGFSRVLSNLKAVMKNWMSFNWVPSNLRAVMENWISFILYWIGLNGFSRVLSNYSKGFQYLCTALNKLNKSYQIC